MKLKFNKVSTPLTEAGPIINLDRGARAKAAEVVGKQVESALTAAGYKCKLAESRGFYILPKFGYLTKAEIGMNVDEDGERTFSFKVLNWHGENLAVEGVAKNKDLTAEELAEAIDNIGITLMAPVIGLKGTLTEDLILEYGPVGKFFTKVGNVLHDLHDKIINHPVANKVAKDSDKNTLRTIGDLLKDALTDAIKAEAIGETYVKPVVTVDADKATIILKSDFILAVMLDAVVGQPNKNRVSKIITPLGELKVKPTDATANIGQALLSIGKKLDVNFSAVSAVKKLKSGDDTDSESDTDSEVDTDADGADALDMDDDSTASGLEGELLAAVGADAAAILTGVSEELELDEALRLKMPAAKYDKAIDKVDNDGFDALIKYFLLKETSLGEDKVKKISPLTIGLIKDIVLDNGKTFDLGTNAPLQAIVFYGKNYTKHFTKLVELFTKLLDKGINPKVTEMNKTEGRDIDAVLQNKLSILYAPELFRTSTSDVDELYEILRLWYDTKYTEDKLWTDATQKKFEVTKDELKDTYGIDTASIKNGVDAKKAIMLDPSGKKFRGYKTIQAIMSVINSADADDVEIDIDSESSEDVPEISRDDVDLDRLISAINSDSADAKAARRLLTKLLGASAE